MNRDDLAPFRGHYVHLLLAGWLYVDCLGYMTENDSVYHAITAEGVHSVTTLTDTVLEFCTTVELRLATPAEIAEIELSYGFQPREFVILTLPVPAGAGADREISPPFSP